MASFCGTCGSVIAEKAGFCGKCGAQVQPAGQLPSSASGPQTVAASTPNSPAHQKSNGLLKVALAVVAVLAVGGILALAAAVYAAHKVSEKAHAVTRQVLGDSTPAAGGLASMLKSAAGSDREDSQFKGDPCRFLSKEDVSQAVGVTIIRAQGEGVGCSYIAHGDPADMTSRHMTCMASSQLAAKGETVDPKTQQMMQQITGAFFKQQESSDKELSAHAATGEVPVLGVSFSSGNAELEMKVNRTGFNRITQGGENKSTDEMATGDLAGIGDDAYEMGGTSLMVRKGNVIARFMFPYCPCSANAIKPLAAKVASQL